MRPTLHMQKPEKNGTEPHICVLTLNNGDKRVNLAGLQCESGDRNMSEGRKELMIVKHPVVFPMGNSYCRGGEHVGR